MLSKPPTSVGYLPALAAERLRQGATDVTLVFSAPLLSTAITSPALTVGKSRTASAG